MAHCEMENPFLDYIKADPWESCHVDVEAIHRDVFENCRAALGFVREKRKSRSILIYGEAGSGKTHLMTRIRGYVDRLQFPGAIFVAVRCQSAPTTLRRLLRRCFVGDLLRTGADGLTHLERVVLARYLELDGSCHPLKWLSALRGAAGESPGALRVAEKEIADLWEALYVRTGLRLEQNVKKSISHLLLGRHCAAARDWLLDGHGDGQSSAELGLVEELEERPAEELALEIVVNLCALAGPRVPIVLCFDQLEALQMKPKDTQGLFEFGRLVRELRDRTANAVLISCVQSSFLDVLERAANSSDYDAVAGDLQQTLRYLTWEEAKLLAVSRLRSVRDRASLAASESLAPLSPAELRACFDSEPCTPRRLIAFCRDKFQSWYLGGGFSEAVSLPAFLAGRLQEAEERAERGFGVTPSDHIISQALPLAWGLVERGEAEILTHDEDVDIRIVNDDGATYVSLCNGNGIKLTRRLRHLSERCERGELANLVLIRDDANPISRGARIAQAHWSELAERARVVRPTAAMLVALDALRVVLSDAKAGDLAYNGATVSLAEVECWLRDNLRDEVKTLLAQCTPAARPQDGVRLLDELIELLKRRRVVSVPESARELNCDEKDVQLCLAAHTDHFGTIGEPPQLIFQIAA